MPLIIVPVTVTDSMGASSCACAALVIVKASAPNDAPHNSARFNPLRACTLKNMKNSPQDVQLLGISGTQRACL
jgi:hypothetical protein